MGSVVDVGSHSYKSSLVFDMLSEYSEQYPNLMNLVVCLFTVLFTLKLILADPVIDVDVSTTTPPPSYTYIADTDSRELVYRCISSGSDDGLVWRYNNVDYTNSLNAYQFYGVVQGIRVYSIECYSGDTSVGTMELTLRDSANITIEYSGQREVYQLSSANYYTVTIPVNTPDIVVTCEFSRGYIYSQNIGFSSTTINPNVTFTLTSRSGSREVVCARDISGVSFGVLTLDIVAGDAVTTPTVTTTIAATTNATTVTTPIATTQPDTTTPTTTPTPTAATTTTATTATTTTVATTPTTSPTVAATTTTTQSISTTTPTPTIVTQTVTPPPPIIHSIKTTVQTTPTTRVNDTQTELGDTTTLYLIIGVLVGVFVILIPVTIVIILVIVFMVNRMKTKRSGYTKHKQMNNTEDTTPGVNNNKKEYIYLDDLPTKPVPPSNSKKPVYKKLLQTDTPITSPIESPPEDKDGYMTLDQLEGSIGAGGESDPCVEEKVVPNDEFQYENVRPSLYVSTTAKYTHDQCATLVPLSQFKKHLSHLLGESRLEKEYRQLGKQGLRYECSHALRNENSARNKYKLIYPYDKSRVVLTSNKDSDYINASYVPGFYVSHTFIVAQAPKKNTVTHFWQMILEQRVSTVVMLTRVVELGKEKCTSYWPQGVGTSCKYEGIKVTLKREDKYVCYFRREMEVTGPDSSSYSLTQFHYVGWPDHDVPQLFIELLDFTQMIKKHLLRERTPLLVHCSAGVGRSGTFITLYNLLEAVGVGETISVYRIVNEMREHRPQMVQTFSQYKFIYLAVLEMIFGMTGISSGDFCDIYKLYLQSRGDSGDVFREQFEEICYQSDCSFTYPQEAARDPSNAGKNAMQDVLPYDVNRVILYSPNWSCEYINASYMGSYEMIVTMLPTQETIQDFLQLVYQLEDPLVVLLFTQSEYQQVRSGASNRVCYWLEENGKKEFGEFSTTTEKSQKFSSLIHHKMKVHSNYDSYEKSFSQFISLVWEDTGTVNDVVGVLTLLDIIRKHLITPGKKTVFCCNDGIGKSGVLSTLYRTVREIDTGKCIDIFQTVKQIRSYRKNMVPTLEHYMSCYHLINEYCQMNF